jgi:hypothetical protein
MPPGVKESDPVLSWDTGNPLSIRMDLPNSLNEKEHIKSKLY